MVGSLLCPHFFHEKRGLGPKFHEFLILVNFERIKKFSLQRFGPGKINPHSYNIQKPPTIRVKELVSWSHGTPEEGNKINIAKKNNNSISKDRIFYPIY